MNTYILDDGDLWLEKVRARSFTEAEDKFIDLFITDYDIDLQVIMMNWQVLWLKTKR